MLLRWLIDNYLRDAAEGKVRAVVGGLSQEIRGQISDAGKQHFAGPEPQNLSESPQPILEGPESSPATTDREFLPCDIAFVFALGIESGGLVDALRNTETSRHTHGTEHAGKLGSREVVIVDGGVGQRAAARATIEAIKFYQPKWVISAGFAGGLDAALRRGHIVMADEVVNLAGERLSVGLKLDSQSLAGTKGLHVGRLVTVDTILRQPAERRRLAEQQQAIACDMETYAVAQACQQHHVPLLAVRIISDAVDDELPAEIERLLAQKSLAGKLGAAAGAILKRFSAAKDLWQLREDAIKASDRLAKFLVGIASQLKNNQ
jgi:adenosylhomocysteine nucleosidase